MTRKLSNSVSDKLKYEIASELGYITTNLQDFNFEISEEFGTSSNSNNSFKGQYSDFLNKAKFEIANELGIQLNNEYNGDITSKDAGKIGGRIGGNIGGNMVKRMVEYVQNHMKNNNGQL